MKKEEILRLHKKDNCLYDEMAASSHRKSYETAVIGLYVLGVLLVLLKHALHQPAEDILALLFSIPCGSCFYQAYRTKDWTKAVFGGFLLLLTLYFLISYLLPLLPS